MYDRVEFDDYLGNIGSMVERNGKASSVMVRLDGYVDL